MLLLLSCASRIDSRSMSRFDSQLTSRLDTRKCQSIRQEFRAVDRQGFAVDSTGFTVDSTGNSTRRSIDSSQTRLPQSNRCRSTGFSRIDRNCSRFDSIRQAVSSTVPDLDWCCRILSRFDRSACRFDRLQGSGSCRLDCHSTVSPVE